MPVSDTIARLGAKVLSSRRLMRAPIWLFRARFGFVFRSRLLMLEHLGRQSGTRRYVVLEAFGHPDPDTYIVLSGLGTRSQWFRNVRAHPRVRVTIGGRRPARAVARVLTPGEADAALDEYANQHHRAWNTFKPIIETTLGGRVDDPATEMPMVALKVLRGKLANPRIRRTIGDRGCGR